MLKCLANCIAAKMRPKQAQCFMKFDQQKMDMLCIRALCVLPPMVAKANIYTLMRNGLRPFTIVEICSQRAAASCCVTVDATIEEGVLEVHDWVLRHLGASHGGQLAVRVTTRKPVMGSMKFVELSTWVQAPSPAMPRAIQHCSPINVVSETLGATHRENDSYQVRGISQALQSRCLLMETFEYFSVLDELMQALT